MRVVLVHDLVMQWGGAERVLAALASLFPDAPIYTLFYDERLARERFSGRDIRGSFLQKLPRWLRTRHRLLFPLMPMAAALLPIKEYDLVISSSSAFAKGVRRGSQAVHVCYCHAPARFLWDDREKYQTDNRLNFFARWAIVMLMFPLRIWDKKSAERVDLWIANSKTTQERIRRLYHAPAAVVYPPIPALGQERTAPPRRDGYFLAVSRLSAFKKIDVIVQAFSGIDERLIVVGTGREEARLRRMAESNVTFTGFVSDHELAGYYAGCTALIVACDDDFGLSAAEALSFGKPVLAYRKGGVTEWMEPGVTGEFFAEQTPEAVHACVRMFCEKPGSYDPAYLKKKADAFSEKRFLEHIARLIPR